jgi:lipopolysaccharide export system protein LptA
MQEQRLSLNMPKRQLLWFFLPILITKVCFALPDDREKALELSADNADLNQQTHNGEFSGNVQLDQGTTHLRAAHVKTEGNKQNKLVMAEAKGNAKEQAHFWTLKALDQPPLHAYAHTIRYFPERHLIELIGEAKVIQGKNSFEAPQINYDTEKQHVLSKRDGTARTLIIIHPEKKT